MIGDLFQPGGPYNVRKTGPDEYSFKIPIPEDEHGRTARKCPNAQCSPAYFKVKMGTGITEGDPAVFCPYCRTTGEPSDFMTDEQKRYGTEILGQEALKGAERALKQALGIGASGKKRIDAGFFALEMRVRADPPKPIRHPFEEEVLRGVVCPHCGLDHAVFGLATWCPDCGRDIFMTHVEAEYAVVRTTLSDIERRRQELGPRIAGRDLENCIEDMVSIYEAVLKAMLVRHLRLGGMTEEEVETVLRKEVRNGFQNPECAAEIVRSRMNLELYDGLPSESVLRLRNTFEKRHPITHNLGVTDRKYLEKVMAAEQEGKDIRVSREEIEEAIGLCMNVLTALHQRAFRNGNTQTVPIPQ